MVKNKPFAVPMLPAASTAATLKVWTEFPGTEGVTVSDVVKVPPLAGVLSSTAHQ